jgi:hypothetical protein
LRTPAAEDLLVSWIGAAKALVSKRRAVNVVEKCMMNMLVCLFGL